MQAIGRGKLVVLTTAVALGCAGGAAPGPSPAVAPAGSAAALPPASPGQLRDWLSVLAADSLRGRATATSGAAKAARLIAEAMHEMGLQPAGDSGYYQRVPLFRTASGLALADSLQGAEFTDVNVVGILPGAD